MGTIPTIPENSGILFSDAQRASAEQYVGLPYRYHKRSTMALDKPYLDIPGTTVFDTDQAAKGYHLNQFAVSLMKAENRERFRADADAYLDGWPMTEDQKQAVRDRDYNRMIDLGGNIYFVAKIGATDGFNYVQIVSSMTENDADAHAQMMINGGRSPDGNRYLHEWDDRD